MRRLPRLALPIATLLLAALAIGVARRPSAVDHGQLYAVSIRAGEEADAANAANAALNAMDRDFQ